MNTLLITAVALIFAAALYYLYHSRIITKEYALSKFKHNREENLRFYNELKSYVKSNNIGGFYAFENSNITFDEVIDTLYEKFSIEFSELQLRNLSQGRYTEAQIRDLIDRMEHHTEIIDTLQENLRHEFDGYKNQAIA